MIKNMLILAWLRFLSWLPLGLSRKVGVFIGSLLYITNSRMAQTTKINIQICFPELDKTQQQDLARQSLRETGKTITESGAVWLWPESKVMACIDRVTNKHLLEEAVAGNKGVIILGPHHGNWEVLGLYLGQCGLAPCISLFQKPDNEALAELMLKARMRGGATLVPTNNRGVSKLMQGLKEGSIAGILPDQVPNEAGGSFAPFFNRPAFTMTLVSRLIQKTGSKALMGYTKRTEKGFEIVFQQPDPRLFSEDVDISLTGLNASVENVVANEPKLYQWDYKRFRRQPDDKDLPY